MSRQTKGAGNVYRLHVDKESKVEPLDGWRVQTKYGTLRLRDGTDCVRLEDVHLWMCSEGKAYKQAIYAIFLKFLDVAREVDSGCFENMDTLFSLRLVNVGETPVPVFAQVYSCRWDEDPNKCECMKAVVVVQFHQDGLREKDTFLQRFIPPVALSKIRDVQLLKRAFPSLGHVRFEDDTPGGFLYAMCEGAQRVWFGGVDIKSDYLAAHDAKKSQETDEQYGIRWPRDAVLAGFLNRLAVPVAVAYQLWGWGRVVSDAKNTVPVIELAPATSWSDVVAWKKGNKDKPYPSKFKTVLFEEFNRRVIQAGSEKGIAKAMAEELGVSVAAFNRAKANQVGSRQKVRDRYTQTA